MSFGSHVNSVNLTLNFKIDETAGQSELNQFGYGYTEDGRLMSLLSKDDPPNTERKRVGRFPSQGAYEEFGLALENYIYWILENVYKMTPHSNSNSSDSQNSNSPKSNSKLTEKDENTIENESKKSEKESKNDDNDNDNDDKANSEKTDKKNEKTNDKKKTRKRIIGRGRTIFTSENYESKDTILMLIPGSGAVRAGQWARSICINDNLASGTMFSFIDKAYKRDWGVIMFDPNGKEDITNNSSRMLFSDGHVIQGYNQLIAPLIYDEKISNLLIVCHSAGGGATSRLLGSNVDRTKREFGGFCNVLIAGTDTWFIQPPSHNSGQRNIVYEKLYTNNIVNWKTSNKKGDSMLQGSYNPLKKNNNNNNKKSKQKNAWYQRGMGNGNGYFREEQRSCGHTAHEYSSPAAIAFIFTFFDARLNTSERKKTPNDKESGSKKEENDDDDVETTTPLTAAVDVAVDVAVPVVDSDTQVCKDEKENDSVVTTDTGPIESEIDKNSNKMELDNEKDNDTENGNDQKDKNEDSSNVNGDDNGSANVKENTDGDVDQDTDMANAK